MPLRLPADMKISYESSVNSSFQVICPEDDTPVVWYQVSMLEYNRPAGLLPLAVRMRNGRAAFCYDITSRLTLEFFLKRKKLKRYELIRLMSGLARPLAECEGFLLKDYGFLLDIGLIYVNPDTMETYMPYVPVKLEEDTAKALKVFMGDLVINHTRIEEEGCDNYLQRILSFIKRENFNIRDFLTLLEELIRPEAADTPVPEHPAAVLDKTESENTAIVKVFKRLFFGKSRPELKSSGSNPVSGFAEATKPPVGAEKYSDETARTPVEAVIPPVQAKTELLGMKKPVYPVLKSRNSQEYEEIHISKPEFVIGRLSGQVDHVCRNSAIGKVHAIITRKEDGSLNIRDLNSMNGTFVNNERIDSNQDVVIKDNDIIMLANSEYMLVS